MVHVTHCIDSSYITDEMVIAHAEMGDYRFMGQILMTAMNNFNDCIGLSKMRSDFCHETLIIIDYKTYEGKPYREMFDMGQIRKMLDGMDITAHKASGVVKV